MRQCSALRSQTGKIPFFSNFGGNFGSEDARRRGSGIATGRTYGMGVFATVAKGLTSMVTDAFHNLNKKAVREETEQIRPLSANQKVRSLFGDSFGGGGGNGANNTSSIFGLNSTPEAQKANAQATGFIRNMFNPFTGLASEQAKFKDTEDFRKHRVHPFFKINNPELFPETNAGSKAAANKGPTDPFMGGGSFGGGSFGGGSFGGGNMGGMGMPPFGGGGGAGGGGGGGPGSGGGPLGGGLFEKMLEWCSVSHAKDIARRMGIDLRDIKFTFGPNGECTVKVDAPNATPYQIKQLGEAVQQECPVARFRKTSVKSDAQEMRWELLTPK